MKLNRNHLILLVTMLVFFRPEVSAQEIGRQTKDDRFEQLQLGLSDVPPAAAGKVHQATPPPNPLAQGAQKITACASAFIMNTPYNSNNGQRGCMFDILAANPITIRCFESNVYAGTTANYEIYYRAGTHVGFENNAAAWTFLGGATGITSAGNNLPTALPIPVNVTIPAGARYSFYITNDFGGGTSYTDGTAVGNFLASDANLTIYEGVGKSYPFGLTFNVRNFNGHIFYDAAGPLDANQAGLTAEANAQTIQLNWETPSAENMRAQFLQRSGDGQNFQEVFNNHDLAAKTGYVDHDVAQSSTYYYRLKNLLTNGEVQFSEIVTARLVSQHAINISEIKPNPFSDHISFKLQVGDAQPTTVELLNSVGQSVLRKVIAPTTGSQDITLHANQLPAGIYTLMVYNGESRTIKKLVHL